MIRQINLNPTKTNPHIQKKPQRNVWHNHCGSPHIVLSFEVGTLDMRKLHEDAAFTKTNTVLQGQRMSLRHVRYIVSKEGRAVFEHVENWTMPSSCMACAPWSIT